MISSFMSLFLSLSLSISLILCPPLSFFFSLPKSLPLHPHPESQCREGTSRQLLTHFVSLALHYPRGSYVMRMIPGPLSRRRGRGGRGAGGKGLAVSECFQLFKSISPSMLRLSLSPFVCLVFDSLAPSSLSFLRCLKPKEKMKK